MMTTLAPVQYRHSLLIKSRYFEPKTLKAMHSSMTHQYISMVCHSFGDQSSSRHSAIALRISCAPPKLMDVVTVQLPTSVSQPVIHDAMGAYFFDDSMADQ